MSTATATRFEFRCTSCYQGLLGETELAGSTIDCQWCGAQVHVPEPTDVAIARAEDYGDDYAANGTPIDFSDDQQLSAKERKKLAAKIAREKMKGQRCKNPATASAGRFERFAAFVIDRIVLIALTLACFKIALLFAPETVLADAAAQTAPIPWLFLGVGLGGPIVYIISCWVTIAFYGKTIGKFVLGIKIVDGSGFAPGFFQGVVLRQSIAVLHAIAPLLPLLDALNWLPAFITVDSATAFDLAKLYIGVLALFDIALIFLEPPRCLHDRIAGTYVINDN